jgi:hypothetical protein
MPCLEILDFLPTRATGNCLSSWGSNMSYYLKPQLSLLIITQTIPTRIFSHAAGSIFQRTKKIGKIFSIISPFEIR